MIDMDLLELKKGKDLVKVEPGSEAEANWRARGFLAAGEKAPAKKAPAKKAAAKKG
jgi:hypothetical protein